MANPCLIVENGFSRDTAVKPARLTVTVHNVGDATAVQKQVKLELLDDAAVNFCGGEGGDIPITGTFAATVPPDLGRGEVIKINLKQFQKPDEATSIAVDLQMPAG